MNFLWEFLQSPSGFSKNPWKYFWNQVGHAYVVGYGLTFVGIHWWLVIIGYCLWELTQWIWFNAEPWDCLEDLIHVSLLAMAAHYKLIMLVVIQILLLASGFLRRKEEAKND